VSSAASLEDTVSSVEPNLFNIGKTFALISLTAFGGGQMTSMRREVVKRMGWLTDDEFVEYLSLLPTMPGPLPIGLAVLIGLKFRGFMGAAVALFSCIIPAFLMLMLFAWIYLSQPADSWVHALFRGCAAAVVGINLANAYELTMPFIRRPIALAVMAATIYGVSMLHVSLELVLFTLAPLSVILRWRLGKL